MHTSRRKFIKDISFTAILIAGGGLKILSAADVNSLSKKAVLRFAIASDGHYGEHGTLYNDFFQNTIRDINDFHRKNALKFTIINGDIIHNKKEFLTHAKHHLDKLEMPYHVGKGNHDMVSDEYWKQVWGTAPNHSISYKKGQFIIANTSNEKGDYLMPDLQWLKEELETSRNKRNVFLVLHIPQTKWTANAIESPEFFDLIKNYPNIKAVFHGHEHDQDGVKMRNNIPYLFDAHFGGSWGTSYKGFRVVELLKDNSMLTYVMNPAEKINESVY